MVAAGRAAALDNCLGTDAKSSVQLWCWIDGEWSTLRIYTYYLFIWICIVTSAIIYVAVGYHVFHQRNQLRNLTLSHQGKEVTTTDGGESSAENKVTSHRRRRRCAT